MSAKAPFRLTELLIAAVIVMGALVWAERTAWREISTLRAEMNVEQIEKLAAADRLAAERFVTGTNATLIRVQRFLFLSLLGLLFSGAVVVVLIYRRMIAPLRSTLTESRAIIERQEKLASLGVLATGIAHEIRNPLTAIKVRLFTLKNSHRAGTSEHEDLEVIHNEINRLECIVREFLQFARPAEPELQTMPVGKLLRATCELLESELARRAIKLKLDLRTDELVRVDLDKMKQVLINFVQNGADSMKPGGTVVLRSRLDWQVLNARPVNAVVIDIVDTGKGMPPEVQRRLFDPFFTTKEEGTGLGLPISARIVEKHGGVIQYQTQPDRGTTFSIVLPSAPKHEIESQSAAD
ncbi:MAG TPA: ATP-binding protein [Candidatus Paceibacterota bacterium]|nr:ATP-binding protein [Verrucomicrobiota bacterium]HSA09807.1 ATP-binding protein [Candidatus Paceibacterota bacterium]